MKRYLSILCIAITCAYASAQTALSPDIFHFISLNGDLGYSALLHTIKDVPASAGVNANIGVAYRLYYNNFIMSVGAEGAYQINLNHIEDLDFALRMQDTEGDLFDMHVQVEKSRDRNHMLNLNIPLLLGGEWQRFYFFVGPKLAINLYGSAVTQAEYTTSGEYERYYDDFFDMENHQFVTGSKMVSGVMDIKWNMNILAHFEIGARVGKYNRHRVFKNNPDNIRMYVGAYMDFGVLNLIPTGQNNDIFYYVETEDKGLQFYVQPLMRSSLANDAVVRNLNVGIKYTVAFELPQKGKSYIYEYDRVNSHYRKRGGNQYIQ